VESKAVSFGKTEDRNVASLIINDENIVTCDNVPKSGLEYEFGSLVFISFLTLVTKRIFWSNLHPLLILQSLGLAKLFSTGLSGFRRTLYL